MIHFEPLPSSQLERLFPGDSEMARRMRALDWSATDFGPPETWPENLRVSRQHLPPLPLSHAALVGPKLLVFSIMTPICPG